MAQTIPRCVNHPDVETRLACSSCGAPICTRCMRQSAVGQKCPACARVPRRARALGKPIHYVRAVGAGLGTALVGGLAVGQALGMLPFGSIILLALLGFGVGRAVRWGAQHQTSGPFAAIAVVCGIAAAMVAGGGPLVVVRPYLLLGAAAAGYFAWRGLQG